MLQCSNVVKVQSYGCFNHLHQGVDRPHQSASHLPHDGEVYVGKPCAISSNGNSVLYLICSIEKADDTPSNWAALISFL